jgi:transaldolase
MMGSEDAVPKKLDAATAHSLDLVKKSYIDDENAFRFDFNEDAMGVEKLREGISKFAADAVTLKAMLQQKIEA